MKMRMIVVSVLGALVLVVTALVVSARTSATAAGTPRTTVAQDFAAISADVDALSASGSAIGASSNPFDYARNSPSLERLVAKGTPALRVIEARISSSRYSGLEEYLLMIAAMRISKVDVTNGPADSPLRGVDDAKQWAEAWRAYLTAIPGNVESIDASSLSWAEKNRRLAALGTPAIPYLLDKVAAGRTEFAPAVDQLLPGCIEMGGVSEVDVTPEWASANDSRFAELRMLVESP